TDAFGYVIEAGNAVAEVDEDAETAQLQFSEDEPEGFISSADEIELPAEEVEEPVDSRLIEQEAGEVPLGDSIKVERNSDGERNFVSVDAGGFEQMEFTFEDECWVEINDGGQGLIYHDLNREDDVLTVYGTLPFRILLGKATGVEMIYNGRPFDLGPYIGQDKTAKLTISE
ncbi:MAG: DUF4115 domain-containing protein, partial [Gammaproteobacteria bacterium]|nr:DUF4115 domain-containing protein [Gammaproteobacteria bacterium]